MISIIAAISKNGIIGKNNKIPWKLPEDLKYFKTTTSNYTIVMGRKTFESIGKPLPNRKNVILTKNQNYKAEGCIIVNSIEEILQMSLNEDIFVIGGANIYKQFLSYADKLYITEIDYNFDGDTFFPNVNYSEWKRLSRTKGIKDDKNPYDYYFSIYQKCI